MNYRADIDGMRAIAVTTVILFHYGVAGFTGGFIGVDVFFVLSGYLIGSIIFSQLDKGRFTFGTFYFRRIRRLFPVYLAVMVATFACAYWVMLPRDFREFGQSLFSSTIYISNIL
ncbi:MAG: peptidoglycan/LPS O-acetylase OafA/YrhL, partial [Lentisphaeria bacterium]